MENFCFQSEIEIEDSVDGDNRLIPKAKLG